MMFWVVMIIAVAVLAVLALRTPSTFLFDLIEGCFSHGHPTHRR